MASTSVVYDILAKDRASDKFDHLGKAIGGTSTKMHIFTGIMQGVGQAAFRAVGVGIREAVGGLVGMAKAAIDDQHSVALLTTAVENATGATDGQIASLDRWVGKLSLASGIADDDLRPALSRLVTATGDVGKSQDLMRLAMDASAVTGKSLEQVTAALARGYTGTTGSLGRLGIATKDASGEALTFTQITDAMSQKFAGGMQTSAATAAGSMARLKVALSEAGESIGYILLPYVTKLANWLTSDVVPAMQRFINQMQNGRGEGGRFAAQMKDIGERLKSAAIYVNNNREAIGKMAAGLGTLTAALKVAKTAQIGLNIAAATNPYVALAEAVIALGLAYAYAYKHSERFRAAAQDVNGVLISQGVAVVATAYRIRSGLTTAMIVLTKAVIGTKETFEALGFAIARTIDSAIGKVQSLIAWFQNLIDKASSFHMPDLHLPGNPLGRSGTQAGQQFGQAFKAAWVAVAFSVNTMLEPLQAQLDAARDALGALRDRRNELANTPIVYDAFKKANLFGADTSGGALDESGAPTGPTGIAALLAFAAKQKSDAQGLATDVTTLVGKGLSQDLIDQLKAQGASGIAQIHTLANASAQEIAQINADMAAADAANIAAGMAAGDKERADRAAELAAIDAQMAAAAGATTSLAALVQKIVDNPVAIEFVLDLGGKTVRKQILADARANGRPHQYIVTV